MPGLDACRLPIGDTADYQSALPAYCEPGEDGRTVLIAQVRPAKAELLADGRAVAFRDAFEGDGVVADVFYEISEYSIAQDVIVRGRLPDPEYFGLAANSYLAIATEFYMPPALRQLAAREGEFDRTLHWGTMGIIRGKAFSLGEDSSKVDVQKVWLESDGRTLLYETVPHPWIKEDLQRLPVLKQPLREPSLSIPSEHEQGSYTPRGQSRKLENLIARNLKPILPGFASAPLRQRAPRGGQPATELAGLAGLGSPGFVIDFTLVDYPVISIDFGAGHGEKRGFAAIGRTSSDLWNVYDLQSAASTNIFYANGLSLLYTDGSLSGASVEVLNAPGGWSFQSSMQAVDPMYDDYMYPLAGEATVTINSLAAGSYDFYLYGHGPAENANTVFKVETSGLSTAAGGAAWSTAHWLEGQQYVVFRNVEVEEGQSVTITAAPGESGYALLSGMQIGRTGQLMAPPEVELGAQSKTIPAGGAAVLCARASGSGPLTYQWRKDGSLLEGATNAIYQVLGAEVSDAGSYSVEVSGVGGTVSSPEMMLLLSGGSCAPLPSGAVAWWSGDYSTEDLALDNDLYWVGTPTYETAVVGQGYRTSSGKYVYAPYSLSLDVGTGAGFTVEAWIKRYDNNPGPLFQWGSAAGQGVTLWANYETVGGLFGVIMEANGQGHVTGVANALPLNEFAHVALTYEASTGDTKIYINGVLVRTTNDGILGPLKTAMNLYLGYRPHDGACFNGVFDEPSVYNRALSVSDIEAIYSAGGNGKCTWPACTVADGVDQPAWSLIGLGQAPWSCQGSIVCPDGDGDAAQSGIIGHSQSSGMQTTVNGPGSLTFYWKVSSQQNCDFLRFCLDGTPQDQISGSVDWAYRSFGVPSGAHTLTWEYAKDSSVDSGSDAGWVDLVQFGSCLPPPTGLAGWWPGDNSPADLVHGNTVTMYNGSDYTTTQDGKVDQSFRFDGANDYASVASSSYLNPTTGLTVEAWVYQTGNQNQNMALISKDGCYSDRQYFLTVSSGQHFRAHISTTGSGLVYFDSYATVQLNAWYHVAMTYDGVNLSLYINGVLSRSAPATGNLIVTSQPVHIGGSTSGGWGDYKFAGRIDEHTIYNRALNSSSIYGLYTAGAGGKCKAPPDSDGDGLPDWWESQYGLNPQNPTDANGDQDADGYTNLQEFANGTHPNLANARVTIFEPKAGVNIP
jgi:hypothetical protein